MNVTVEENLKENLFALFAELPAEMQAEVIDFAEFLHQKKRKLETEALTPNVRVAGLHDGQGWISDDFNDELPDEFWFGEDFGIIEKDNETTP